MLMSKKFVTIALGFALFSLGLLVVVLLQKSREYPIKVEYDPPVIPESESPKQSEDYEQASDLSEDTAQQSTDDLQDQPPYEEQQNTETVQFPLELNSASAEELTLIPSVGEVTAQRIVQYREHLGGYTELEQLKQIKGIGEKTYDEISPYFYLKGDSWDLSRDKSEN